MCLKETKLTRDSIFQIRDNKVWRKGKEDGRAGSILLAERSGVRIMEVKYGEGKAETVKVGRKNGDNMEVMMVYISFRTNE